MSALSLLSGNYDELGDVKNAYKYAQEAYETAVEAKDTIAIVYAAVNLGLAYQNIGALDDATRLYKNTFILNQSINGSYTHYLLNGLGLLYERRELWDSALIYYRMCLKTSNDNGLQRDGIDYHNIGSIKKELKEFDSAEYYFNLSIKSFKESGSYIYRSYPYYGLGELKFETGQYDKAAFYFSQSLQLAQKENNIEQVSQSFEKLHDVYLKLNDIKKANKFYNEFKKVSDSLDTEKQKKETLNHIYLNEIKKVQHERYSLLQRLKGYKYYSTLYFYLLMLNIMVFLVLVYLYIVYRKRNKELFLRVEELTAEAIARNEDVKFIENKPKKNNKCVDIKVNEKLKSDLLKWISSKDFLKPVTLVQLANKLNTNTRYLACLITKEYDKDFREFIDDLRINYCLKELVSNKNLQMYSVDALAKHMGYKSKSTFYKAFKQRTGVTPYYFIKSKK